MRLFHYLLPMLVLATSQVHAFGFSPFKARLSPASQKASQLFEIRNDEDYPQAIQISVHRWQHQPDGTEVNQSADDVLSVYPNQFVLKPGSTQAIRLRYTGTATPSAEQAFRVVAEQLPVSLDARPDTRKAIRFLVTYRAALYVTPDDAQPRIEPIGVQSQTIKGERYLAVSLANRGSAHALVKKPVFTFYTPQTSYKVDATGLANLDGENIHAGSQREFLVPWPSGLKEVPQRVAVDFTPDF